MLGLAFLTGLFGSLHCVGMCGAIALTLPARSFLGNFLYNAGRVISYSLMGFLLGSFGKGLAIIGFQQGLAIVGGSMVILIAIFPKLLRFTWFNEGFTKLKQLFKPFYQRKNHFSLLMIGVLNGFLPCGLVYLAIMASVVLADAWQGMLYMFFFGLGTIPMMQSLALYKSLLSQHWRMRLFKWMPAFAVMIGILMILRGLNLGIPYVSPHFEKQNVMECHSTK